MRFVWRKIAKKKAKAPQRSAPNVGKYIIWHAARPLEAKKVVPAVQFWRFWRRQKSGFKPFACFNCLTLLSTARIALLGGIFEDKICDHFHLQFLLV
jgi:hypothetical protein